jgi:purine-binding chemotaxis protein CheW
VIPILDLRVRFGLSRLRDHHRSKWILVRIEGKTMGLAVDKVTDVFGTGGVDVRPAPSLGGGEDQRGILGVTSHEGQLVFVLDVTRFQSLVIDLPVQARIGMGEA